MSARTAERRRQAEPVGFDDPLDDPATDGIFVRVVSRIIENPALSGGIFVVALTTAAVVSNAIFFQSTHHPEPWFGAPPVARSGGPAVQEPPEVPDPRLRAEVASPEAVSQAGPDVARADVPAVPVAPSRPATSPTLVADLQRGLAERGLYQGKVDGLYGAQTRAAISAYEKAQGLPVTGEASAVVLDHMTTASIAPVNASIPATPVTTVTVDVPAVPVASDSGAAEAEEILSYPPRAQTVSADPSPPPVAEPATARVDIGAQRTLAVQKALNQIGYGPVPEDGMNGENTVSAIRRFEADNALPVTGAAGDTLIERLVAIGAMEAV